jgi:hypothetical protein
MKNILSPWLFLLLSIYPSLTLAQVKMRLVAEERADGLASFTVIIPTADFSKTTLLELANKYLSENPGIKLLQLGIYTEDRAAHESAGKQVFDITYGAWHKEVERRTLDNTFPAAELLKYGSSSTLRVRFPGGQLEEIPISGASVFHRKIDNCDLSLLHLSLSRKGFGKGKQLIPIFYFKATRGIKLAEAGVMAETFAHSIAVSKPEIHFREDEWYVFDAAYPWVNPFVHSGSLPSEAEVAKSAEFVCRPGKDETCYQIH